jgi:adenosylhomocysteine nucleosidase
MEKARAVCRAAFAGRSFDFAIASGFACALTAAAVGDLLIGTEVVLGGARNGQADADQVLACSPHLVALALRSARDAGLVARQGRLVTVPHVIGRAREKREVAAGAEAIGLDMESAAVCEVAIAKGVPVLVARAVSDLLDEDLPLNFNHFLQPGGWTRGVIACLTHPSALLGLNRLRVQAGVGAARLTCFFGRFLDDLE